MGTDLFEGVDVDRCEGHYRRPPKNKKWFAKNLDYESDK
jgi:hypothetical protein